MRFTLSEISGSVLLVVLVGWMFLSPFSSCAQEDRVFTKGSNKKWGVLNSSGDTIIPMVYDGILSINPDYVQVKFKGKWGVYHNDGKRVVPIGFQSNIQFSENGTFEISSNETVSHNPERPMFRAIRNHIDFFFDAANGKLVDFEVYNKKIWDLDLGDYFNIEQGFLEYYVDGLSGLVSEQGETILDPEYDEIVAKESYGIVFKGRAKGLIDLHGIPLSKVEYQEFSSIKEFPDLLVVRKSDKYGMMTIAGTEILPCDYDYIHFDHGGFALTKDGKKGRMDAAFRIILPCEYDYIENPESYLNEGYPGLTQNGKHGLMDSNYNILIAPMYDERIHFVSNKKCAKIISEGKIGMTDSTGKVLIEPVYDELGYFFDDFARVMRNGKHGVIDTYGKEVVPCVYDEEISFSVFGASVKQKGKYGKLDGTGKLVIPCLYDAEISFLWGNYTNVIREGRHGVVDVNGNLVIPCKYEHISTYSYPFFTFKQNGKHGRMDTTGKVVVPPVFDQYIEQEKNFFRTTLNGKVGAYGLDGKLMLDPVYDDISYYKGPFVHVRKKGLSGIFDTRAKTFVFDIKYTSFFWPQDDCIRFQTSSGWGLADTNMNVVQAPVLDEIRVFKEGKSIVRKGKRYGIMNRAGKLIVPIKYDIRVLEDSLYQRETIETIVQVQRPIYGMSLNHDGSLLLTYSTRWITLFDARTRRPLDDLCVNNNPHVSDMGYIQIEHAGFLNENYLYYSTYTSGGEGKNLNIVRISDLSSKLNVPDSNQHYSYIVPHVTKENTLLYGTFGYAGTYKHNVGIHEYDYQLGKTVTIRSEVMEGPNTFRVKGQPQWHPTLPYLAYYDQISEEVRVYNYQTGKLVLKTHGTFGFLTGKTCFYTVENDQLNTYNLLTGQLISTSDLRDASDVQPHPDVWYQISSRTLVERGTGFLKVFDLAKQKFGSKILLPNKEEPREFTREGNLLFVSDKNHNLYEVELDSDQNPKTTLSFQNNQKLITEYLDQSSFSNNLFEFQSNDRAYQLNLSDLSISSTPEFPGKSLALYQENYSIYTRRGRSGKEDTIFLYDNARKETIRSLLIRQRPIVAGGIKCALSTGNQWLGASTPDSVYLFSVLSGEKRWSMNVESYTTAFIAFDQSGKYLLQSIRAHGENQLIVIENEKGKVINTIQLPEKRNSDRWDQWIKIGEKTFEIVLDGNPLDIRKRQPEKDLRVRSGDEKERYITRDPANDTYFYHYMQGLEFFRAGKKVSTIYVFEDGAVVCFTPDNYYFSTRDAIERMNFNYKGKVYSFEQFDLRFNRPDIVLQRMGFASDKLIESYQKAYEKRLKKMGFEESDFKGDSGFYVPEIELKDFNFLPVITEKSLDLGMVIKDERYELDRIKLWVNDVAVYGRKGINIREKHQKQYETNLKVNLLRGKNNIKVSVLNEAGIESLKSEVDVVCNAGKAKPDLYMIAFGAGEFEQSEYNLTYAKKDAQDMVSLFETNSAYGNVQIREIYHKDVVKESLEDLKTFLEQAEVDDEVILFFAGHGVLDDHLNYYFATYNMDFGNPAAKGIAYDTLEQLLDGIKPLKKIMLVDACHSGEIDKEEVELMAKRVDTEEDVVFRSIGKTRPETKIGVNNISELTKTLFADLRKGTGATVISSAGGMEFAMESEEWKNGLFTYCFLQGLKTGKADLNQDGQILLSEIREYVTQTVSALSHGKQVPTSRIENIKMDHVIWKVK